MAPKKEVCFLGSVQENLGIPGNTRPKKGTPMYLECVRLMAEKIWTRKVYWNGGNWVNDWWSRFCIRFYHFSIQVRRWTCLLMQKQWKSFWWIIEFLFWMLGYRTLVLLGSETVVCGFASTSLRSSSKLYFLTEKEHPTAWFLLSG